VWKYDILYGVVVIATIAIIVYCCGRRHKDEFQTQDLSIIEEKQNTTIEGLSLTQENTKEQVNFLKCHE
jgi:hypothetical protein